MVTNQSLDYYINNALATIEKYKQNPPAQDDEQSIEELARAATIAKLAGKLDNNMEKLLFNEYKISVNTSDFIVRIIKEEPNSVNKKIAFNQDYINPTDDSNLLTIVKNINSLNFVNN